MNYITFKNNYNRFPKKCIFGLDSEVFSTLGEIVEQLSKYENGILAIEAYPGTDLSQFKQIIIDKIPATISINIENAKLSNSEFDSRFKELMTEDRVFGKMGYTSIEDFYDSTKINDIKTILSSTKGLKIVYGFGATLIKYDNLVYFDITRWEIQSRYRRGLKNFTSDNREEDVLKKFKRGYFLEWRVADKIKNRHFTNSDFIISGDDIEHPVMVSMLAYLKGLDSLSTSPFRLIPYFDPGIWGGQWMKEICGLPNNSSNYAWSFDGVPEENALAIDFGKAIFVFPAINLVFFRSVDLLGEKVYGRFGKEFPIRFDFLDTMNGGNLSLQVHPTTHYIQNVFGMHYTQDESYYIMDASKDSVVYLGIKNNVNIDDFFVDIENANKGFNKFDVTKYINTIKVKKHDHILIPAGTIHCSGKNTMVLEISATPYIFTFKLWDWGRVGLDGISRPVHLNHGREVIDFSRNTDYVNNFLVNQFKKISENEISTGLHEREFIETRRLTITSYIETYTEGSVNVLNLVDGEMASIESVDGSFIPFEVHYAETFIVPASVKKYIIRNISKDQKIMVIKAYVR